MECSWLVEGHLQVSLDSLALPPWFGGRWWICTMYRVEQDQQERNHPTLPVIPPLGETPGYEGGWEVQPGPIYGG